MELHKVCVVRTRTVYCSTHGYSVQYTCTFGSIFSDFPKTRPGSHTNIYGSPQIFTGPQPNEIARTMISPLVRTTLRLICFMVLIEVLKAQGSTKSPSPSHCIEHEITHYAFTRLAPNSQADDRRGEANDALNSSVACNISIPSCCILSIEDTCSMRSHKTGNIDAANRTSPSVGGRW